MQGYKVKEKTAIVPHCTPSFKNSVGTLVSSFNINFVKKLTKIMLPMLKRYADYEFHELF